MKNTKIETLSIITIICILSMIAALFLPYAAAIPEHAENLKLYPDTVVYEAIGMTSEDIINISMIDYARIYYNIGNTLLGSSLYGIIYAGMAVLVGLFSLLTLLFAIAKKPIGIIIFDIFAFTVYYVQCWDYTERGVVPSDNYSWGMAYYIFYAAAIITALAAAWMLVEKMKAKNNK